MQMLPNSWNSRGIHTITLNDPRGVEWKLRGMHIGEGFVLIHWDDFVHANGMKEKDILVFNCLGDVTFDVSIVDVMTFLA